MPMIATDPGLLDLLQRAAQVQVTGQHLREQRVSFIYGSLPENSTITRDQIRKTLETIEG
jgi:hypothetical protein